MKRRPLLKNPILWTSASTIAAAIVFACSNSSSPAGGGGTASCTAGQDTVACECQNGQSGTQICGEPATCTCNAASSSSGGSSSGSGSGSSSGAVSDDGGPRGDGSRDDGATPVALYSACMVKGSFGYPCSLTTSGVDQGECTDPNYPYCFVGGQGAWCTTECQATPDDASACFAAAADSGATGLDGGGCIPTDCNKQGYCK